MDDVLKLIKFYLNEIQYYLKLKVFIYALVFVELLYIYIFWFFGIGEDILLIMKKPLFWHGDNSRSLENAKHSNQQINHALYEDHPFLSDVEAWTSLSVFFFLSDRNSSSIANDNDKAGQMMSDSI